MSGISESKSVGSSSQSYGSQGAGSTSGVGKTEAKSSPAKTEPAKTESVPRDNVAISKEAKEPEKAEKGSKLNIAALTGADKKQAETPSIDPALFDQAKGKFEDGETLPQKDGQITTSKDGKTAYSVSDMDVCTDGSGKTHGDNHHQNKTSYAPGGKSLNADENPYVVLSPQAAKAAGMQKGDLAAVKYGDKVLPAVFGEVGPKNKIGEGSYKLVRELMGKENINPNNSKIAGPNVETMYFPGSGKDWKKEDLTIEKLMPEVQRLLQERAGIQQ
ncbi:MAG: glycoside hydrolase family 75 protein [Firmicutes bacterium]|nr:glycoside hydrolase family 75 protein [Bacillota bacterium]